MSRAILKLRVAAQAAEYQTGRLAASTHRDATARCRQDLREGGGSKSHRRWCIAAWSADNQGNEGDSFHDPEREECCIRRKDGEAKATQGYERAMPAVVEQAQWKSIAHLFYCQGSSWALDQSLEGHQGSSTDSGSPAPAAPFGEQAEQAASLLCHDKYPAFGGHTSVALAGKGTMDGPA